MTGDLQIVTDPVGYDIHLPVDLCAGEAAEPFASLMSERLYDVVETPACIIELPSGKRCYFRSLGWNFTVLICVVFEDEKWLANECQKNPSKEYIQELLEKGKFIAAGSLD